MGTLRAVVKCGGINMVGVPRSLSSTDLVEMVDAILGDCPRAFISFEEAQGSYAVDNRLPAYVYSITGPYKEGDKRFPKKYHGKPYRLRYINGNRYGKKKQGGWFPDIHTALVATQLLIK